MEEGKVCKLRKAIYGLKQSPRAWFERFSGAMVEIGFRRCHADYSVFIKRRAEGSLSPERSVPHPYLLPKEFLNVPRFQTRELKSD